MTNQRARGNRLRRYTWAIYRRGASSIRLVLWGLGMKLAIIRRTVVEAHAAKHRGEGAAKGLVAPSAATSPDDDDYVKADLGNEEALSSRWIPRGGGGALVPTGQISRSGQARHFGSEKVHVRWPRVLISVWCSSSTSADQSAGAISINRSSVLRASALLSTRPSRLSHAQVVTINTDGTPSQRAEVHDRSACFDPTPSKRSTRSGSCPCDSSSRNQATASRSVE